MLLTGLMTNCQQENCVNTFKIDPQSPIVKVNRKGNRKMDAIKIALLDGQSMKTDVNNIDYFQ